MNERKFNNITRFALKKEKLDLKNSLAYQKIEYLLKNYNKFKFAVKNNPSSSRSTKKIIDLIDEALNLLSNDPYFSIIEMYYFEGKTREKIADFYDVEPKTITRNKIRLINELQLFIFSDDIVNKLFS